MPLQYNNTSGKLLYVNTPYGYRLQGECWCGDDAVFYYPCCIPTEGDPYNKRYLIISKAKYIDLGSPTHVEYNNCLYYIDTPDIYTGCGVNVDEDDVTASTDTCETFDGTDCDACRSCWHCTKALTPSYVWATISYPPFYSNTIACGFTEQGWVGLFNWYCRYSWVDGANYLNVDFIVNCERPPYAGPQISITGNLNGSGAFLYFQDIDEGLCIDDPLSVKDMWCEFAGSVTSGAFSAIIVQP
jgi:hypothetical protein